MSTSKKKRRLPKALPPAGASARLLVRLDPHQVGLFRFLLEAYDNLAAFTVLDRREGLLKVFFSPHQEREALACLHDIHTLLPLDIRPWPATF